LEGRGFDKPGYLLLLKGGFHKPAICSFEGRVFKPRRKDRPKLRLYSLLKNSILGGAALQALR
jgi:hypothetical protein